MKTERTSEILFFFFRRMKKIEQNKFTTGDAMKN